VHQTLHYSLQLQGAQVLVHLDYLVQDVPLCLNLVFGWSSFPQVGSSMLQLHQGIEGQV
jgi:hypothetical protein